MANWSDPRPGVAPFGARADVRAGVYDQGLRAFMLSVYNYMASGVLLTGVVALLFARTELRGLLFREDNHPTVLGLLTIIAPLGIVMTMSFGRNRLNTGTLKGLFWAYTVLLGMSLSTIFMIYSGASIAGAFFGTAAGFAAISLYGYTTKRDLSAFATFLLIGLVGLLVASIIAIFVPTLNPIVSVLGVLIFAGLTAWNTQQTKSLYFAVAGGPNEERAIVMSALSLYLDFINMFLYLLRIFGSSRN